VVPERITSDILPRLAFVGAAIFVALLYWYVYLRGAMHRKERKIA
jgi:hypothetical protein